jgi:hypothetical protein
MLNMCGVHNVKSLALIKAISCFNCWEWLAHIVFLLFPGIDTEREVVVVCMYAYVCVLDVWGWLMPNVLNFLIWKIETTEQVVKTITLLVKMSWSLVNCFQWMSVTSNAQTSLQMGKKVWENASQHNHTSYDRTGWVITEVIMKDLQDLQKKAFSQ